MTGGALAFRGVEGRRPRRRDELDSARLLAQIGARAKGGALRQTAPAAVVTFAGLQGGAGVSTATMLLTTAVTVASDRPALAIDLAGMTGGGLGGLVGAWSTTPAVTTAQLMLEGARIARPYIETRDGVHAITAPPDEITCARTVGHELVAMLQAAMNRGATDEALAALCRDAVDAVDVGGVHDHSAGGTEALRAFIGRARPVYGLIGTDLGICDQQPLTGLLGDSDLHVWVIAARREDLETVAARLIAQPRLADREALLLWVPERNTVRHKQLRALSAARDCPLVKLPTVAWTADWASRTRACATSLETLCRLLP